MPTSTGLAWGSRPPTASDAGGLRLPGLSDARILDQNVVGELREELEAKTTDIRRFQQDTVQEIQRRQAQVLQEIDRKAWADLSTLFEPVLKGWAVIYPEFRLVPFVDAYQIAVLFFLTVVPYTVSTIVPSWRAATIDPDAVMRA